MEGETVSNNPRTNRGAAGMPKQDWHCDNCGRDFHLPKGAFGTHRRFCTEDPIPRFWAKVEKRNPDQCWPWKGAVTTHGYGNAAHKGRNFGAHKLAYIFAGGHVPDGLEILHSCDNRLCCNPAHLGVGTKKDNAADKVARNRIPASNPMKLTAESARAIKAARGKASSGQLAKQYGITQSYVFQLWRGTAWKSA